MGSSLALHGGPPVRSRPFPDWPVWGAEEEQALLAVLRSGLWNSVRGSRVLEFESVFAGFQEARHCTCVANGTLALVVALQAAGIGPGDEVIVPPYTFIASASAVAMAGAVPVFADVSPDTLLLDPGAVAAAIGPRTRAVMAVHIAGCPCDMDALSALAQRRGLLLVEDAAQAHGAAWRGRRVGAIGHVGTFSFQASKNLNAGEGGAVVTNDSRMADMVWSLTNVGRVRGGAWYQHEYIGSNLRLTEFQGALLLAQFGRLEAQIACRAENARRLTGLLGGIPGISPVAVDPRVTSHAWHLYMVRIDPARWQISPSEVLAALRAEGIPATAGYVSLNQNRALLREIARLKGVTEVAPTACPVSEAAQHEVIWLPQQVLLGNPSDLEDVSAAFQKVAGHAGR